LGDTVQNSIATATWCPSCVYYCVYVCVYVCMYVCMFVCMYACITCIVRNHQPAHKVPKLWSFHGWYSSSAWGQLPVATSLSDPPSPPRPRSNPTDRPTNMWLRPLLGRRPTRSTWRTSKSERPSSCKKPSIAGARCYCEQKSINSKAVLLVQRKCPDLKELN
jgi:hypothetical protein